MALLRHQTAYATFWALDDREIPPTAFDGPDPRPKLGWLFASNHRFVMRGAVIHPCFNVISTADTVVRGLCKRRFVLPYLAQVDIKEPAWPDGIKAI